MAGLPGPKRHQHVLDWLSPLDFRAQHDQILSHHTRGTGQWLLDHTDFQAWLNSPTQSSLLLTGKAGSGKTTLTAVVVEYIGKLRGGGRTGIAAYYINGRTQALKLSFADFLASIVKQLCFALPTLPDAVAEIYRNHHRYGKHASEDEILEVLKMIMGSFTEIFVVVDGLDEWNTDHTPTFIDLLFRLPWNVRLFMTSRPHMFLNDYFETTASHTARIFIEALNQKDDVQRFVQATLGERSDLSPALRQQTERAICEMSEGSFLLAKMLLQAKQNMQSSTAGVPKTLYQVYDDMISEIESLDPGESRRAKAAMMWVVYAPHPLTQSELCDATTFAERNPTLRQKKVQHDFKYLERLCKGFLTSSVGVDGNQNTAYVRCAHESVRDYLVSEKSHILSNARITLARACFQYLSLQEFQKGACASDEDFKQRLQAYPLFAYIARHWPNLARDIPEVKELALQFLKDRKLVQSSCQALFSPLAGIHQFNGRQQALPPRITGLHLAAMLGLDEQVSILLKESVMPCGKDSAGEAGRTPLWRAIEAGHHSTAKLLSERDPVTLPMLIRKGETALAKDVIALGSALDRSDLRGETPLFTAVDGCRVEMVKALLEAGADPDFKIYINVTALGWAVRKRSPVLVDLLLAHSADAANVGVEAWPHVLPDWDDSGSIVLTELESGGTSIALEPGPFPSFPPDAKSRSGSLRYFELPTQQWTRQPLSAWDTHTTGWSALETALDGNPFHYNVHSFNENHCEYSLASTFQIHSPNTTGLTMETAVTTDNCVLDSDGFVLAVKEFIHWKAVYEEDSEGIQRWKTTKHSGNFPYLFLPKGGIDLMQHFVARLDKRWVELCGIAHQRLSDYRRRVLSARYDKDYLHQLLQDAQLWVDWRDALSHQVERLRDFSTEYSYKHNEVNDLPELRHMIDGLQSKISAELDDLDRVSQTLIELDFNLVSIQEARTSTGISISMSRLSWITFIFLPLSFISGLFGMNVDILESNPAWWIYIPFAVGTLGLTFGVWLLFKAFPELENKMERSFRRLLRAQSSFPMRYA